MALPPSAADVKDAVDLSTLYYVFALAFYQKEVA